MLDDGLSPSMDPFREEFMSSYNWNLVKTLFALFFIIIIQSDHNFAHVTTTLLSWQVQIFDPELIINFHL